MSNAQTQTRGLSAGDWIRLKRLIGARSNGYSNGSTDGVLTDSSPIFNKDVVPTVNPQLPYHLPIHSYNVVGTSKIRRTASAWTDYRASQTADYVLPRVFQGGSPLSYAKLSVTKLCNCETDPLETKLAGCSKCRYDPVENYTRTVCGPNSTIYEIDFNDAVEGLGGSLFVPFTVPNNCSSQLNFRYINLPDTSDDWTPEVDANTTLDGSGLAINDTVYPVAYTQPYYSDFGVYFSNKNPIVNSDILTLTVPDGISGTIYVGAYEVGMVLLGLRS